MQESDKSNRTKKEEASMQESDKSNRTKKKRIRHKKNAS